MNLHRVVQEIDGGGKMRLQRIYSSKLYLTSSRKDKIKAAIEDTDKIWNVELVQQLEDYLDDDSKKILRQAQADIQQKESGKTQDSDGQVIQPDEGEDSFGGGGASSGGSSFSGDVFTDFGDDELADIEMPDEGGEEAPEEPEAVESVTQEGKPITATSVIWTSEEDAANECEIIKGTLNAREDTRGVARLQVKDSELWIYYNDESNLNDIMIDVISVLNSVGYTYLKFNRLARSNNAIVFDILMNKEPVKSKAQIEEEK